jgi:hypothetical protein
MDVISADWTRLSQVHFGGAELGDRRRSGQLVKTAELIFKSPAGSLPTPPNWTTRIARCWPRSWVRSATAGGRGYLCHNTLAVAPDRRVFGLASQILHQRRKASQGE